MDKNSVANIALVAAVTIGGLALLRIHPRGGNSATPISSPTPLLTPDWNAVRNSKGQIVGHLPPPIPYNLIKSASAPLVSQMAFSPDAHLLAAITRRANKSELVVWSVDAALKHAGKPLARTTDFSDNSTNGLAVYGLKWSGAKSLLVGVNHDSISFQLTQKRQGTKSTKQPLWTLKRGVEIMPPAIIEQGAYNELDEGVLWDTESDLVMWTRQVDGTRETVAASLSHPDFIELPAELSKPETIQVFAPAPRKPQTHLIGALWSSQSPLLDYGGNLQVWDVTDKHVKWQKKFPSKVNGMMWTPDGRYLIGGGAPMDNGRLDVFDGNNGKLLAHLNEAELGSSVLLGADKLAYIKGERFFGRNEAPPRLVVRLLPTGKMIDRVALTESLFAEGVVKSKTKQPLSPMLRPEITDIITASPRGELLAIVLNRPKALTPPGYKGAFSIIPVHEIYIVDPKKANVSPHSGIWKLSL